MTILASNRISVAYKSENCHIYILPIDLPLYDPPPNASLDYAVNYFVDIWIRLTSLFKENVHVIDELKQNLFDIALVEGYVGAIAQIPEALEIPYIVQAECLIEPGISGYLNLPSQSSYKSVPVPLSLWQA